MVFWLKWPSYHVSMAELKWILISMFFFLSLHLLSHNQVNLWRIISGAYLIGFSVTCFLVITSWTAALYGMGNSSLLYKFLYVLVVFTYKPNHVHFISLMTLYKILELWTICILLLLLMTESTWQFRSSIKISWCIITAHYWCY